MRRRSELNPRLWEEIRPLLPDPTHHGGRGHPWNDHSTLINGILWVLHTGAPWRDVPERYGPWQTVYDRFNRWRQDGTWAKVLDTLLLRLDRRGVIRRDLWCVDATINRAGAAAAGAKKKSGRSAAAGRAESDANGGAARARAGALAGRLRHQDASGLRQRRHPAGRVGNRRSAP